LRTKWESLGHGNNFISGSRNLRKVINKIHERNS